MATPEARSWLLPGARGNFLSVGTFCNPHPMCVQVTLYQRAMQFSIGKMQLGFPKHYNPHTMPVKVALIVSVQCKCIDERQSTQNVFPTAPTRAGSPNLCSAIIITLYQFQQCNGTQY